MKCLYYPGCSQKSTSLSYERSFLAIARFLNIEVEELEDWNCCGTTAIISLNKHLACSVAARNLALAESRNLPLVTPCPSCYISLHRVNLIFQKDPELAAQINRHLGRGGLVYMGTVKVYHLLEYLMKMVSLEKIRSRICYPLRNRRVAPYYGCQITRPYSGGDDLNNPRYLDQLIEALGGEPVDFALKSQCCGGALMITRQNVAAEMCHKILDDIRFAGADLIVTPCGLCQYNLQSAAGRRRSRSAPDKNPPILNLAQLIELTFDLRNQDAYLKKIHPRLHKDKNISQGGSHV